MRTPLKLLIVPYLIKGLMMLITMTCRVRWHNKELLQQLAEEDRAAIFSFWHNCSTFAPWAMRDRGYTCMVSASRDGEYVARLGALFGNNTVRGSSSKGSAGATRKILKLLRQGNMVALTPDGPRGPKYQVQSGIVFLAASASVPIVPLHIEANRQWVLNSWDNHLFPKPFSTIHIGLGKPIMIDQVLVKEQPENAIEIVRVAMMSNVSMLIEAANA
ncbi:MAG: lysophospholipid acyltransferase (LPLAT)-like uncharacterized protein [Cryomorphaceae bacterium]|jgi:lysophospholipid acyltransferase (LPLAT)-like uncharacterized protein